MKNSSARFIGSIVCGRFHSNKDFTVERVLGTGFVVDPAKRLVLTCEHVLPQSDRESSFDFAFATLDESNQFQAFQIDKSFSRQWMTNDLQLLKLVTPGNLETVEISDEKVLFGAQVLVVGLPLNHHTSTKDSMTVVPRAITGFIVSGYELEFEIDSPVIVTMSGSPVLHKGKVVGVAHKNVQYSRELIVEETEEVRSADGTFAKHIYTYNEVQKYGVFYKAIKFSDWLAAEISKA